VTGRDIMDHLIAGERNPSAGPARARRGRVAGISAVLAPHADLNTGAARTVLRKAVLAGRNGGKR
jgi:hypothetical protein